MKITFTSTEERERFVVFLRDCADPVDVEIEPGQYTLDMLDNMLDEAQERDSYWLSAWESYQLDMVEQGNLVAAEAASALGVSEDTVVHMLKERCLDRYLDEQLDQVCGQEAW